ncbi:MAG: hypothetical protein WKH64_01335 [Chloroflexia bacterium]
MSLWLDGPAFALQPGKDAPLGAPLRSFRVGHYLPLRLDGFGQLFNVALGSINFLLAPSLPCSRKVTLCVLELVFQLAQHARRGRPPHQVLAQPLDPGVEVAREVNILSRFE